MRDLSSPSKFLSTLEEYLKKNFERSRFSSELLSLIVRPSEGNWENSFRIKTQNLNFLLFLGILSWYIDPGFGILLRFAIEEKKKDNEDLQILDFVLESKASCQLFLINTTRWTTQSFYGNIVSRKHFRELIRKVRPCFRNKKKPSYPIRRRGYKDKGSLGNAAFHPRFFNLNKEERIIEEKKKTQEDSIQLFLGYYG